MPEARMNIYEQTKLILPNLAAGNIDAASRAIFARNTLSPEERKTISDRILGDEETKSLLGRVVDTVTNPMVALGLLLTVRFPLPGSQKFLETGNKLLSYAKKHFPAMDAISDFHYIFRDTPLPKYMEYVARTSAVTTSRYLKQYRTVIEDYERLSGRAMDKATSIRVGMYMDGLDDPQHAIWKMARERASNGRQLLGAGSPITLNLTAREVELAENLATINRGLYHEVAGLKGSPQRQALVKQLQGLGFNVSSIEDISRYFPHIEVMTKEKARQKYEEWLSVAARQGHGAMRAQIVGQTEKRAMSRRVLHRKNWMLPSEDDLRAAGVWTPKLERLYQGLDNMVSKSGEPLPPMLRYGLDIHKTHVNYVHVMARAKAWHVAPAGASEAVGPRIMQELDEVAAVNPTKANMLKDTYIPLATGQLTWEQYMASARFSDFKHWAYDSIQKMPIPASTKKALSRPFLNEHNLSWQSLGSRIQSWLYNSTLMFNPLSPMRNMMQTLTNTYPVLGFKYTAKGIEQTLSRTRQYYAFRGKGLAPEAAFERAFKEFSSTGFDISTAQERLDFLSVLEADQKGILSRGKLAKQWEKIQDKGLWMFTRSERFNRLSAFYGGYYKALDELPGTAWRDEVRQISHKALRRGTPELTAAAIQVGDEVARLTQFGGGPLAIPYLTTKWWAPLRQYTQFPTRQLHFAITRLQDPAMAGRMLLGSGLAYEGGKALLNTDVSDALIFGGIPQPGTDSDSFFGKMPLISPFLQIAGSTANALLTGDVEDLLGNAPLLVPGGLQLARLSSTLAPPVAEAIGRAHVDYSSPTPDGRYPVYTRTGALQGLYSPTQLFAKSIGLGDINTAQEQALMKYLLANRDHMREARRQFVEATMNGDHRTAESVKAQWSKSYPGLGPLEVTKQDIRAAQLRREVTRLERMLDTMPADVRAEYGKVITGSLGLQLPEFLGVDPMLLEAPHGTADRRSTGRVARQPAGQLPTPWNSNPAQAAAQAGEVRRDDLLANSFTAPRGFL